MSVTGLQPDLILLARRCHPLTPPRRRPHGVAIRAGRILALGTRAHLRALRGRGTRVVDLPEAVLTPGLVDCHAHFFYWALQRALVIDVANLSPLAATLARIRREAVRKTIGGWVIASGFDYNRWGRDLPQAADLDRAVSDRPALVRSRDGHTAWLNTCALTRASINARTPDPPGGRYLRDARGRPTGIVQETALDRLPDPLRDFARRSDRATLRTIDRALAQAYQTAWSFGLVGVHCVDDDTSLFHLQRHRRQQRLGIRVVHAIPLANHAHAVALGLRSGLGDDWLRLGGVKIFADGALGSQTAYMFAAYPGRPGGHGVAVLAGEELQEAVVDAARAGWPVWVHAVGDRAVHDAISAIAAARRVETAFLPHRIEHVQCIRPGDVSRLVRHRISASVQPSHLIGDIPTADRHWPRARRNAFALRRMLEAGVTLAAGSDVPIEALDPRRSFFAAACRTDERGRPAGGWFADQKITAEQMLRAFTVGAAASVGQVPPAGSLAPGAPADITIWQEDPLTVPPRALLDVGIAGCVVGGQLHLSEDA